MRERLVSHDSVPIENPTHLEIMRKLVLGKSDWQIVTDLGMTIFEVRSYLAQIRHIYASEERDGIVLAVRAGFDHGQLVPDFNRETVEELLGIPGLGSVWPQTMEGFSPSAIGRIIGMEEKEVVNLRVKINNKFHTTRYGAVLIGLAAKQAGFAAKLAGQ